VANPSHLSLIADIGDAGIFPANVFRP